MYRKVTVKNFTDLTDFSALFRAGLYLAGKNEEAEEDGYRFKVMEKSNISAVIKIMKKSEA